MKKFPLILIVVVLVLVGWFAFGSTKTGASLLDDTAGITLYRFGNAIPDQGFIEIHFRADEEQWWIANAFIGDEWVVKNQRALVRKDSPNRFAFTAPEAAKGTRGPVNIRIELTKNTVRDPDAFNGIDGRSYAAELSVVDIVEQFGLNVPGSSEELKRGVGILVPSAEARDFDTQRKGDVPDLSGGPMDCSAVAATNNILSLMDEHLSDAEVPDPPAMIEELKKDMQWNDGIINRNFLTGKNAFVKRYHLPIRTEEIVQPRMDDLEDALSSGGAVEISTRMIRSSSGKPNTGHTFTGVAASQDGSSISIGVHDPATPQGTDMLQTTISAGDNPYIILRYPLWDGIVLVDAIFVQAWMEDGEENSSESHTAPPEEENNISTTTAPSAKVAMKEIEGLIRIDEFYPLFQFHESPKDACPGPHWHADSPVYAISGFSMSDPDRDACGFGRVGIGTGIVHKKKVTEAEIGRFTSLKWENL